MPTRTSNGELDLPIHLNNSRGERTLAGVNFYSIERRADAEVLYVTGNFRRIDLADDAAIRAAIVDAIGRMDRETGDGFYDELDLVVVCPFDVGRHHGRDTFINAFGPAVVLDAELFPLRRREARDTVWGAELVTPVAELTAESWRWIVPD